MKKTVRLVSIFLACASLCVFLACCSPKEQQKGSLNSSGITIPETESEATSDAGDSKKPDADKDSASSKQDAVSSRLGRNPVSSDKSNVSSKDEGEGKDEGFYKPIDTSGMTELQKAVVLTAESYWIRQERVQYEDTRINATKSRDQWRWGFIKNNTPESYTSQDVAYSNCAAWTHEVYYNALDLDIKQYQTAQLCKLKMSQDKRVVFKAEKDGYDFNTPEKIAALTEQIKKTIQPGDLVVYVRESTGWGHVMMYVGNGMMLHCSGSSYSWDTKTEKYETAGIRYDPIDSWFDESSSRYLFDKKTVSIVRPLATFTGEIPQKTLDRMTTMRGVVAEKLCSVNKGVTVSLGDEITYTIKLTNYSLDKKTINVTDVVPEFTTYVSGAQSKNGHNLSWKITLPAEKSVSVSYTVKADRRHHIIEGDSGKVENIPLKCHDVHIQNTLTKEEQGKIKVAAEQLSASDKRDIILANEIYKEAMGFSPVSDEHDAAFILSAVFENYVGDSSWPSRWQKLKTLGSTYQSMLAPDLYGGRQVIDEEINTGQALERIRLVSEKNLVVGDIIIVNDPQTETYTNTEYTFQPTCYMYLGDGLLNLSTLERIGTEPILEQLLCARHFCVLRPSMIME